MALRMPPADASVLARRAQIISGKALARVWRSERLSRSLARLMRRYPENGPFERARQVAEPDYIAGSRAARTSIAENPVGLPI